MIERISDTVLYNLFFLSFLLRKFLQHLLEYPKNHCCCLVIYERDIFLILENINHFREHVFMEWQITFVFALLKFCVLYFLTLSSKYVLAELPTTIKGGFHMISDDRGSQTIVKRVVSI